MSFQAMNPACVRRNFSTVLALLCPLALPLAATSVACADEPVAVAWYVTAQPANHPAVTLPSLQGGSLGATQLLRVGGGARANGTGNGSLLTQTAPGPAGTQTWLGAAKDHLAADPATLDVYGLYLAVSRDDWEIIVREATGAVAAHPVASISLPPGYVMTSGGCTSNWRTSPNAAGNLLTASFPASPTTWECRGKDHGVASPASLTAYVVGIRPKKPGISPPVMQITTARSDIQSHPSASAPALPGYVVTGGGALAETQRPADPGQLLTASIPETKPMQIGGGSLSLGPSYQVETPTGWRAASKDHAYASPGTVQAFAINLRFGDATTAVGVAIPVAPPVLTTQPTASVAQGARKPPPGFSAMQKPATTGGATMVPTLSGPSAPGPQSLTARTRGTYVQLTWEPMSGAREYMVWRTVGSQRGVKITPPNFTGNELWDAVENPADTYRYSVAVMYTDGRSGNAQVEAKRPFSTANPASLTVERVSDTDVRFKWPQTFGAIAYRIDGGNLPNSGFWVDAGKFTPPAKWTPAVSGDMSVLLPGAVGTDAANFSIIAIYPHALGDYNARTVASLPAIAGRYRITLNGFRCNAMTSDNPLDLDGKADEIYPLVYVHDIDRINGVERAGYYVRTPIYGDSSKSAAWLQAGSGQPNGGIMTGDDVPRVVTPGARLGSVPAMRSEVQPLPALVWSGTLKNGADVLLLKPSIWEYDGGTHIFDPWLAEQRQSSLTTLMQFVGAVDNRGGVAATTVPGFVKPLFSTFRLEYGLLNFFMSNTDDRPVGMVSGSQSQPSATVPQPVIVITRELIEAELAKPPGALGSGVISLTLADTDNRGQTGASYTLFMQVERMP